jgi:hypothetical protein
MGLSVPTLPSLKTMISGALERQLSMIPIGKQAIFFGWYMKLHAVAAFYLKGYIVACATGSRHMIVMIMGMPTGMGPFRNDFGVHRQYGLFVVIAPFLDPAENREQDHSKYKDKKYRNDNRYDGKHIKWTSIIHFYDLPSSNIFE